MTEPVAWVFNLDAELELIDPAYVRSARMRQTIDERLPWLMSNIRAAAGEDPVVVDERTSSGGRPRPRRGDAWCPTPRALALLRDAGVEPPAAPPFDVLCTVNHRGFAAALGGMLPGAGFVTTVRDCVRLLDAEPDRRWLLKRPFGFSGRMRKVVVPRELDAAARTWIAASMEAYGRGLSVEPLVERLADFALHGRIGRDGDVELGRTVAMVCDDDGGFIDARLARPAELGDAEPLALQRTARSVADALIGDGYFGPFCVDAFRWLDERRVPRFQALVEVNARYTMAWWIGMATSRGAAVDARG